MFFKFYLISLIFTLIFLTGSRWAESFEEAVKSPFDSEQDESLADSAIDEKTVDINLSEKRQDM